MPPSSRLDIEEWRLVLRVAASGTFQKSPRLRELLLYLCRRACEGRAEELHEHAIGCEVFGRLQSYQTQEDNIVRVSVSQLRKKLDLYFTGEGSAELVVIEIPRGTYQPLFRLRQAPDSVAAGGVQSAALAPRVQPRLPRAIWALLAAILTALIAVVAVLRNENQALQAEFRPLHGRPASVRAFWQFLFDPGQRTDIVLADSGLAFLQDITGGNVFLDDYTSAQYAEKLVRTPEGRQLAAIVDRLGPREYTSAADTRLAVRITRLTGHLWRSGGIRFARSMETRDFNANNLILLGSQRSNPWSELFEPQMNFLARYDQDEGVPYILNRAPRAGERATYRTEPDGRSKAVFGVVALLPNLTRTGRILLIAGTGMEATEAAGECLANSRSCAQFLEQLGFGTSRAPRFFEAVIQSRRVGVVGINPEVVAYRTFDTPPSVP